MIKQSDPMISVAKQQLAARLGDVWRAGDRLPSVRELAADLQVSHGTVQRALGDLAKNGFLITRPRQGTYVSDEFTDAQLRAVFGQHAHVHPSRQRPLAGKKVVICKTKNATHMHAAEHALSTALASQGCFIEYRPCDEPRDGQNVHLDVPDADALILINPSGHWHTTLQPEQLLLMLTTAATTPHINSLKYDVVTVDQEQGAALAGQYFRARGCESVCYVGVGTHAADCQVTYEPSRPPFLKTAQVRCEGFEMGWGEALAAEHKFYAGAYSPLSGAMVARQYASLNNRPRGVFLACDDLAIGFVNGLATLGLQLQRDYELVGFDGQQQLKNLCQGQAVSVEPDAALMGFHAAELLLDRAKHPDRPRRTLAVGCWLPEQA